MLNVWMLTEFFKSGDTLLPVAALYGPNGPTAPITFGQGYTTPQMPEGSLSMGTIAEVQHNSTSSGSSLAFSSSVTAGHCIVVNLLFTASGAPPTVSDSHGNTYVL